jgi:diacylglycerol diphosphate phosphatase/phosphatidate phosphatase
MEVPDTSSSRWRKLLVLVRRETDFWRWPCLLNYFLIVMLLVSSYLLDKHVSAVERYLPPNDPAVTYPLLDMAVPTWALILAALGIPILIFSVYQLHGRSFHDFHNATLGLLEGFGLSVFFTSLIKPYVGMYRPNQQSAGAREKDRRSFISGHASVAFLCAIYLTLWLCGKTRIMRRTRGALWLQLLLLAPEVAAAALAFSQVRCYYHTVEDVMGGILLGSVLAVWSYHMSYPGPWDPNCGEPKPCEGWKPHFLKRDEEQAPEQPVRLLEAAGTLETAPA